MLQISDLDPFLQFHSMAPQDLKKQEGQLPTLAVQWDQAPELVWTLRLTEMMGSRAQQWGYQPHVQWRADADGALSYVDCPASKEGQAQGRCACKAQVVGDALLFELSLSNDGSETWEDCWGWLCLIHRWARAFQANCELPAGEGEQLWVPASSLRAPMERWLKICPYHERGELAYRIGENQGSRWQPHVVAHHSAVRAWRIEGNRRQFIQLSSPDAALLGWSHWPCTDMGVCFGTLEPGQVGRVSGQLEFFEETFERI